MTYEEYCVQAMLLHAQYLSIKDKIHTLINDQTEPGFSMEHFFVTQMKLLSTQQEAFLASIKELDANMMNKIHF